jgi:hypothetical protein
MVFPGTTRRGNGHDLGPQSVFTEKEHTMTHKIRIAFAVTLLALAAGSAVDSVSAQHWNHVHVSLLALTAASAVDATSAVGAPEFGFDVSAQRRP